MSWPPPEQPQWPPPEQPAWQSASSLAEETGLGSTFGGPEAASWAARLGALLLDVLIAYAILLVPIMAVLAVFGGFDGETTESQDIVLGLVTIVAILASYLYYPVTMARHGARNGQTIGKQAVGIRVVRLSDKPVGFAYAIGREWLAKGIIGALTLGIDYLWPLWDERKQALHDKAAGSLVVRT